jgi:CRISPR-associated protein Cpf1
MQKSLDNFTGLYSLSKTLKFELKPIGKTLEHIQKNGLLNQDEQRAKSYQEMKKIIDNFHKYFIELAMKKANLSALQEFQELYLASPETKKTEQFKKTLEKTQEKLRKEITQAFKADDVKEIFSKIDKKELITELLVDYASNEQEKEEIDKFKTFTTYFTGFHENRKNMYSDKAQSTAIAYRLIHENLPKFLDNIKIFQKLKQVPELYTKCEELYTNLEMYLSLIEKVDDAFELEYYNKVLSQNDIDIYNLIIGGRTASEDGTKIQGLNEYINLYNQKQDKTNRIPKLKLLYKQILSDRNSISFLPDSFEKSEEVLEAIVNYYNANLISFKPADKEDVEYVLEKIKNLIIEIPSLDLNKIYIRNDKAITDISNAIFGDWSIIKTALEYQYDQNVVIGKNGTTTKQNKEREDYFKQSYFTIAEIENALLLYKNNADVLADLSENTLPIANYFKQNFKAKKVNENDKEFDLIANIEAKYSAIKGLLNTTYDKENPLNQDKKAIGNIKEFLDSLMEFLHFVKPLALPKDTTLDKEEQFYNHFETYYEQLQLLIPLYNKVRNYAAKKPYSIEKFKLNFETGSFLSGWATEYSTKGALIVKKDEKYYLTIVDKKLTNDDIEFLKLNSHLNPAKRVIYDFQKPDNKNVPRLFIRSKGDSFAPAVEKYKLPINSVIEIYDNGYFKTEFRKINPEKFKSSLIKLIDYFKEGFTKHESYNHYKFGWKNSNDYEDISEFYNDVVSSCYQLFDEEINYDHLNELINQNKLYLFQIYNKDFSEFSKGKPNMHTLYWKALFDEENLKDVIYKLNGQAEIFYRKKSIQDKNIIIHKANEAVDNKNPLANKKQSLFTYDLLKDKRFTVDKFHFHVPITLNFKSNGTDYINQDVLSYLKNNPDVNIIGLDRGERHLIYLTLINQKGEILKQYSLNEIINEYNGTTIKTDYHQLLQKKEDERANARENWGVVENIKELKEGYVSQVVHKIAKMMVEYNAIVVMEDLNFGFKRGRFKVEKQVYQKLEKMLIDKLNYLVLKENQANKAGGLYKALQLTNKFESFQKIGKQSGFLFYVPAWNTSKIDPTTGFVNLFTIKYESVEKAQEFFNNFDSITWNKTKNYFEFKFDYNNFTTKADGTQTKWIVCTHGERINTFRNPEKNNQWDNQEVNLAQQFEDLFGKYNISYGDGKCIKQQITSQTDKKFYSDLIHYFKLTLQMRNSITNSEVDYLISPVINKHSEFYDSRKADNSLPKDADANGAYHVAKKGLWVLNEINNYKDDDWKKLNIAISNKDWLNFVQNK